jgi:hypothetical protein
MASNHIVSGHEEKPLPLSYFTPTELHRFALLKAIPPLLAGLYSAMSLAAALLAFALKINFSIVGPEPINGTWVNFVIWLIVSLLSLIPSAVIVCFVLLLACILQGQPRRAPRSAIFSFAAGMACAGLAMAVGLIAELGIGWPYLYHEAASLALACSLPIASIAVIRRA